MIEFIQQLERIDMQIFLFFNGLHSDFWDYFMLIFPIVSYGFRFTPASFCYGQKLSYQGCLDHSDSNNSYHYSLRSDSFRLVETYDRKIAS